MVSLDHLAIINAIAPYLGAFEFIYKFLVDLTSKIFNCSPFFQNKRRVVLRSLTSGLGVNPYDLKSLKECLFEQLKVAAGLCRHRNHWPVVLQQCFEYLKILLS